MCEIFLNGVTMGLQAHTHEGVLRVVVSELKFNIALECDSSFGFFF